MSILRTWAGAILPFLLLAGVAAAQDRVIYRRTVTVGHLDRVRTLDPAKAVDPVTKNVLATILDGLYEYAPDGTIFPRIASALPVAKDELTHLIPVRRGIRFHDGTELTAEDVAFSIRRLLEEGDRLHRGNLFDFLADVRVAPGHVVEVRLHYPVPNLLEYLARLEFYPIQKREYLFAGEEFGAVSINGTGPFILESFQRGKSVVLTRNPRYWLSTLRLRRLHQGRPIVGITESDEDEASPFAIATEQEPTVTPTPTPTPGAPEDPSFLYGLPVEPLLDKEKRLPVLGTIEFVGYDDIPSLRSALQGRKAEMAIAIEPRYVAQFTGRGLDAEAAWNNRIVQIYMNTIHPPLHEVEVRRGISLLLDRARLAQDALAGTALSASSPFPPWSRRGGDGAGQEHDVIAGNALLARYGYTPENPLTLDLLVTDAFTFRRIALDLVDQLEGTALNLIPVFLDKKALFDRVYGRDGHDWASYHLALEDWEDYRGGIFPRQFVEQYASDSPENKVYLRDPHLDELLECLPRAEDEGALASLYQRIEAQILESASTAYLCWPRTYWITERVRQEYRTPEGWIQLKDAR